MELIHLLVPQTASFAFAAIALTAAAAPLGDFMAIEAPFMTSDPNG
jgi:hypothetical protein